MRGCCARRFRSSLAGATSSSYRPRSSTTRRLATTRSSAICISRTRSSRRRGNASTKSSPRSRTPPDPFYRRALAELALDDVQAAAADLEQVVERDPKYDYQRAAGLLAHALGKIGQPERALALFAETLEVSTLSETQYNYAALLADQGRKAEAREWADRVLRKKLTMPSYLRRRERPWFRKAAALIKRL